MPPKTTTPLDQLTFDNRFVSELPGDPETDNYRRQVYSACYSYVTPTPVSQPRLVAYSTEAAQSLGLSAADCLSEDFAQIFAGNRLAKGMMPYATCYGGHQFGYWAGQLGDGRAINLGEVVNGQGQRWALQLKGAGLTPYSRSADGLAVLRSSVREFLCSEAMFHLGVPTTRALSLVLTGESVIRDMFYNGNPQVEQGAIVCRMAPSFTRFGSFQLPASRDDLGLLKALLDYTIGTDFADFLPASVELCPSVYAEWFAEVCRRTATLIVHWQRVGFVHGVMNTDNMSILGLTIDYGPYGWLENYDPDWTPNTTDARDRRYRFGNQPQIAFWNLSQLANALYPLIQQAEPLKQALDGYSQAFTVGWQSMMADKLGFVAYQADTDDELFADLSSLLQSVETDMTIFYRKLALIETYRQYPDDYALTPPLQDAFYVPEQLTADYQKRLGEWLQRYRRRLQADGLPEQQKREKMNAVNPKYVLRNYLAQLAIDKAEQGDFSGVNELLEVLRHPYDEQPDKTVFAAKRPDWARSRAGCSMLSCSS